MKYSHTPGICDEVIRIIKEKIKIGFYERSNLSYWSKWFCVLKKEGKSLWIVHDLKPLNAVTIQDSGAPLSFSSMWTILAVEVLIWVLIFLCVWPSKLGHSISGPYDLPDTSWIIRSHYPSHGATNSVHILQGDISFIIQDEMPNIAAAFMDNVNVKGLHSVQNQQCRWYISTTFVDPLPQSAPVPCTPALDHLHLGLDN